MNDDTEFKKWAAKKIKEQSEFLTTNIINGDDPSKMWHTANAGNYTISPNLRSNAVRIHEDMELEIGDETYTYNEIKTMMSVLKEIAKEKRPEEFI